LGHNLFLHCKINFYVYSLLFPSLVKEGLGWFVLIKLLFISPETKMIQILSFILVQVPGFHLFRPPLAPPHLRRGILTASVLAQCFPSLVKEGLGWFVPQ
jgi:hypothetical protein